MKRYNHSKKRDRILKIITDSQDHPSAEEIYGILRTDYPKVSLGTVYRNLAVLTEIGEVRKLDFLSKIVRFDARTEDHYHFICERCGSVYDLDLEVDCGLNERVLTTTGHQAHRHQLEFFGVCRRCAKPDRTSR